MLMPTTSAKPGLSGPILASLSAAVARFVRPFVEAWRHRHDLALLAAMDDHMLRDIGLTRTDVSDAMSQPMWRDPTLVLVRRRGERRHARRSTLVIDLLPRRLAPPLAPPAEVLAFQAGDPRTRLAG
jgi:uncharacterized protein YjiS (DUF1127 family)